MKEATRTTGLKAEQQAQQYLQSHGLRLVASNYHSRFGELDLVMKEGSTWVCVEVKYRRASGHGFAAEFVTVAKLRKIQITFEQFIVAQGLNPVNTPMRVDVVALDGSNLQWLKNVG